MILFVFAGHILSIDFSCIKLCSSNRFKEDITLIVRMKRSSYFALVYISKRYGFNGKWLSNILKKFLSAQIYVYVIRS